MVPVVALAPDVAGPIFGKFHRSKHAGTGLIRFNIANIMVIDALASCIARTSAPMILTM